MNFKSIINKVKYPSISEEDNKFLREQSLIVESFRSGVGDPMESPDSWETLDKIADIHQKELDMMVTVIYKKYNVDSAKFEIYSDGTIRPIGEKNAN